MNGTKTKIYVLGISDSPRIGSFNEALLRTAEELSTESMEITFFDITRIPLLKEADGEPPEVTLLKSAIRQTDALLLAVADYNHGLIDILKSVIDWISRPPEESPLRGKPVAIMGPGTDRLRQLFVSTKNYVLTVPEEFGSAAHKAFDSQGQINDEFAREHIRMLLESLAECTIRLRR